MIGRVIDQVFGDRLLVVIDTELEGMIPDTEPHSYKWTLWHVAKSTQEMAAGYGDLVAGGWIAHKPEDGLFALLVGVIGAYSHVHNDEDDDGNEDLTQAELALRGIVVKSIDQTFNMATLGTLEEIADRVIALVRSSTGISLFSPLLDGPPWPPVDGYATVEEVAERAMNLGTNVIRATHVGPNDEEAFRRPPMRVGSTGPIGAAIFRSDGLILTESLARNGVSVVHGLNTSHPIVQVWVNDMVLTPAVVFAPGPDRVMVRMGDGRQRDNHGLQPLSATAYDKPMTVVIQG